MCSWDSVFAPVRSVPCIFVDTYQVPTYFPESMYVCSVGRDGRLDFVIFSFAFCNCWLYIRTYSHACFESSGGMWRRSCVRAGSP